MASLKNGKTLFFTTSPRTPAKIIPEIRLLADKFTGKVWCRESQVEYIKELSLIPEFKGTGSSSNMDLSARDRINRTPKSLGFVNLKPTIWLTDAGKALLSGKRTDEVLLRQMLKFQIPSPYHTVSNTNTVSFYVKPYLEMIRLVYVLGKITFDEMMIFGMQLTDYRLFDSIVTKIKQFRLGCKNTSDSYKTFLGKTIDSEIVRLYKDEINSGNTATRESSDTSIVNFIRTKKSNLRDYTDACFRYLRSTGIVSISQKGHSLSILSEKKKDVEYILSTVDRNPIFITDEESFKRYLFDSSIPTLYSDNYENLTEFISSNDNIQKKDLSGKSIESLKDIRDEIIRNKRSHVLTEQIKQLKQYKLYFDVVNTFDDIKNKMLYDVPLMLEWNTWRAMTMLDGGTIKGNFQLDDEGQPLSTAIGNMPDIECDYGSFGMTVEVTMQAGQRQYETEGEPVARHLAKFKESIGKDAFCLFIAPTINPATIAHFYTLAQTKISYYKGKSVIIPLELGVFIKMIESSYSVRYTPTPEHIKHLYDYTVQAINEAEDEVEWYHKIKTMAENWLSA